MSTPASVVPASSDLTGASGALVSAAELEVGYSGVSVCAPVTFSVGAGQALFVVGPNGAGKSTLLRTCCGQLPALSGRLSVLGRAPAPQAARFRAAVARELGEEAFFPALSVREHLEMVCLGHGVPAAAEVVETALSEAGLEKLANRVPDQLSSGQRRKLALAACWVRPAHLLILDEPEQRLDHAARVALGERLRSLREAGMTLLVCSHDPALVEAAASAVLLVGPESRLLSVAEGAEVMRAGEL
ncbi:MAG: ATP-binding cassette domain-containing protein [Buchananella hordeovulneris]|nr:ATP-binding cassette domain-containing protein [Buchananella hordeovulneris]